MSYAKTKQIFNRVGVLFRMRFVLKTRLVFFGHVCYIYVSAIRGIKKKRLITNEVDDAVLP